MDEKAATAAAVHKKNADFIFAGLFGSCEPMCDRKYQILTSANITNALDFLECMDSILALEQG